MSNNLLKQVKKNIKTILKFSILGLFLTNTVVFADAENKKTINDIDRSLYKDFKAGDLLDNKYKIEENEIECANIGIALSNISKCYYISENESISTDEDYGLIVSTINDRVNGVHLIKFDQTSSMDINIFNVLYKNNLKSFGSFKAGSNDMLNDTKILTKEELVIKRLNNINEESLKDKNFSIDTVFIEFNSEKYKEGELLNYFNVLKNKPLDVKRIVEIIEMYDNENKTWSYRIDFVNYIVQAILQNDYKLKNNIKEEKL